jgi:hypothetical protein
MEWVKATTTSWIESKETHCLPGLGSVVHKSSTNPTSRTKFKDETCHALLTARERAQCLTVINTTQITLVSVKEIFDVTEDKAVVSRNLTHIEKLHNLHSVEDKTSRHASRTGEMRNTNNISVIRSQRKNSL